MADLPRVLGVSSRSHANLERIGRPFVVGSVLAGLVSLAFLLWMVLVIGGARITDGVDDIGEMVAALIAAVLCGVAAARPSAYRRSWLLLCASSLAWAIGEALWSYFDLVEGVQVPFPSLADVGFLTAIPLMLVGILSFPQGPRRLTNRAQGLFDGSIIAVALLFASWSTILGPIYRAHQGGVLKQVLSLTYPASDVVMLSLVVILVARAGSQRRISLGLVMAGVVAFAVADSSFAYLTEVNNYGIGNFLDTGWVVGYLLIALGALWQHTSQRSDVFYSEDSTLSLMAPYVPVLIVLAVTTVVLLHGRKLEAVSWVMALVLVTLVLAREGLRIWDRHAAERFEAGRPHAAQLDSVSGPGAEG